MLRSFLTRERKTAGTCEAVITVTGRDECENSASIDYTTSIDGEPPEQAVPFPLAIECLEPGGVGADEEVMVDWLGSAVAWDECGQAPLSNDAGSFLREKNATRRPAWIRAPGRAAAISRGAMKSR